MKEQDAVNSAARALYYQQNFDEWMKYSQYEYLDKNVSKSLQNTAASVYTMLKFVKDRYVFVTWRFP